ncbi:MAG: tetratricopeptide repeat protein [Pyrinomonadaceae bacterium]
MRFREEWKWLLPLVAVGVLVYLNSLTGEFVYDDTRQIVRNTLIQDNSLFWKALSSDVWAFKGDGTQAASNYWRPTFTLLNIICFRLFGMSPMGWHVVNLLLHTCVSLLAFLLLRRWQYSAVVAFLIALIFAAHPVHVESVAWIAGSPDLLFSLTLLGSLWFATSYRDSRSNKHLLLTILLYAAALGSKEIGILCLPIYYFVLRDDPDGSQIKASAINTPLLALAAAAVLYFLIRLNIIGAIARPPDDAVALFDAVMSIPEMFAFYLKQIFAPVFVAINYPISPVKEISGMNFVIPLFVSVAAIAGVLYLVRSSKNAMLAAAIFLLPLIPAMNATAFPSEQIVHDRYLYLPLLGALMLLVPLAGKLLSERNLLIAGCVVAVLFGLQTVRYNFAWANELALWTWTKNIDDSAFTSLQFGSALAEEKRYEDAIASYSQAIAKKPTMRAYYGRGRNYNAIKQYDNAEKDLVAALATPADQQDAYALYQVYESLGITYVEQKKYDQAIRNFLNARKDLPIFAAALTEKLAVAHYQAGNKSDAMRELESYVTRARTELLPESKNVILRLGMLYAEAGRKDEARGALNEYLRSTAVYSDKNMIGYRNQAMKVLETLK